MTDKITSAGSGAGAEITALNESLHAYACAARAYLKKDISAADIKPSNVTNANCDRGLQTTLKQLDEEYVYSATTIANQIFKDFPQVRRGNYSFVRGTQDPRVAKIYKVFNDLKGDSGIANVNKWNPADIWIIKDNIQVKGDWVTLEDFNNYLYEQFHAGNIIGVSLKKLEKNGAAHAQIYNNGEKPAAKFTGIRTGSLGGSKDVYIEFTSGNKKGEIQLRTFSSRPQPSAWQGEIKGKTAAGGKIGGGVLMRACVECGIPTGSLVYPSQFTTHINNPKDAILKDFATMFKELSGSRETIKDIAAETKSLAAKDNTWWLTKYLGVHYCYTIINKKKQNQVTSWLYGYGSSATDNSSIFVKYS